MLKKIAVVGSVIAVAGLGVGGMASAWSGAPAAQAAAPSAVSAVATSASTNPGSTSPAKTTPAKGAHAKKHGKKKAGLAAELLRVSHAQWVSKDGKTGTFVTHDAVRGQVTAAAAGSITIKATDGTTETFTVNGSTKVRVAGTGATTVAKVKVGDRADILGTGSTTMTATRIVDRGVAGAKHTGTHHKAATGTAPSAAPTTS